LVLELKNELPDLKGFFERNISLMIAFAREYPDPESILQPVVAKLQASNKVQASLVQLTRLQKVQHPAAQITASPFWNIPWVHHDPRLKRSRLNWAR
jgi:hypothetical protein